MECMEKERGVENRERDYVQCEAGDVTSSVSMQSFFPSVKIDSLDMGPRCKEPKCVRERLRQLNGVYIIVSHYDRPVEKEVSKCDKSVEHIEKEEEMSADFYGSGDYHKEGNALTSYKSLDFPTAHQPWPCG